MAAWEGWKATGIRPKWPRQGRRLALPSEGYIFVDC